MDPQTATRGPDDRTPSGVGPSAHPAGPLRSRLDHLGRVARFAIGSTATFVLIVGAVAGSIPIILTVLGGYSSVVITSGSMQPAIRPGDIVLARPVATGGVDPGTITVFRDPARPGLVTHRVMYTDENGDYITKGDANSANDSTPVAPDRVVGTGRMLIPFVGLPMVWIGEANWVAVGAFSLALALLFRSTRYARRAEFDPWPAPGLHSSLVRPTEVR